MKGPDGSQSEFHRDSLRLILWVSNHADNFVLFKNITYCCLFICFFQYPELLNFELDRFKLISFLKSVFIPFGMFSHWVFSSLFLDEGYIVFQTILLIFNPSGGWWRTFPSSSSDGSSSSGTLILFYCLTAFFYSPINLLLSLPESSLSLSKSNFAKTIYNFL